MKNNVPRDSSQTPLPLTPSILALAVTNNSSLSSSQTVTFNANTSLIEVNAISQGIFMKWNGIATTSSFDEFILAGSTRHYVVPIGVTTAQFLQIAGTATLILIEK